MKSVNERTQSIGGEVLMKFFDLIDGVKEDKHLRVFFPFFVQFLEDGVNDKFMDFSSVIDNFIIIPDSLEGNSSS